MEKRFCIASDHAGFVHKKTIIKYLKEKGIDIHDFGTFNNTSVDYPDYAHKVGSAIQQNEYDVGIVLCGSGNGMNIVVNKYPKVRGALCWNTEIARLARAHNDSNVLCLPARFLNEKEVISIVETFLNTNFDGGRHLKRIKKIEKYE